MHLLAHYVLSFMVVYGNGNTAKNAQEPAMVSGDLEFTIHSSFLLMASLAQITGSLVGMWVVAKGMTWDSHQGCLAGICYLAGLLASIVAGEMAAEVAGRQVFRNREGLVRSEHACECGLLRHCIGDNPRFGPDSHCSPPT